ncbi:ras GTPase-activating protein-binding protein 1-like [Teleopsis dalmanni]|uniref:ras GTPase-activating protein-binding protein 1-like n=1 Tax=Teleopsis dalmanni TaxID=139649 RepID=UPI0018CF1CAE|nr:ras GTPase-activating protein-binding protein 1-like [Teleopsis dalmanni]XP_037955201.1 ras GTPase-activating protein-binding protein 1-like [Teleopsis dalmanni]
MEMAIMEEPKVLPPSPLLIGNEFVRQYYTMLNASPSKLFKYYTNQSTIRRSLDAPIYGIEPIRKYFEELRVTDCRTKVAKINAQASVNNSIIVIVNGEMSESGRPMRPFIQTFVLAKRNSRQYYIFNDIFRFKDFFCGPIYIFDKDSCFLKDDELQAVLANKCLSLPLPELLNLKPPEQMPMNLYEIGQNVIAGEQPIQYLPQTQSVMIDPNHIPEQNTFIIPSRSHMFPGIPNIPDKNFIIPMQTIYYPNTTSTTNACIENMDGGFIPSMNLISNSSDVVPGGFIDTNTDRLSMNPSPIEDSAGDGFQMNPALGSSMPFTKERNIPCPPYDNILGERANKPIVYDNVYTRNAKAAKIEVKHIKRTQEDKQQVFIGGIPPNATNEDIISLFQVFGAIIDLRVIHNPPNSRNPFNYGFLTFESINSVKNCLSSRPIYFPSSDGHGHKLNVEAKKRRLPRPFINMNPNFFTPTPYDTGPIKSYVNEPYNNTANNNRGVMKSFDDKEYEGGIDDSKTDFNKAAIDDRAADPET